jgi:hypothetical protein
MLNFKNAIVFFIAMATLAGFAEEARAGEGSGLIQSLKDLNWEDGRLRLEGQGWASVRSGRRSRTEDNGIAGAIEKDFPVNEKLSMGIRLIPLFYVEEDDHDEYEGNDIWGGGFGLTARYYFEEVHDGWFAEFTESVIGHSDIFNGNSGSANFMSEIGIGYEFDSNWSITAKWRHISNAGFADDNSGVNALGIGIGFAF